MQKRFLFIVWAFILAGTCAYCHTAGPCEVSLRRDSRFTGRGNCGEPLLEITFSPSGGKAELLAVEVRLDASERNISRISLVENGMPSKGGWILFDKSDGKTAPGGRLAAGGRIVASVPVRDSRGIYVLKCRRTLEETAQLTLCADILPDATEGGKVSASVVRIHFKGYELTPSDPEGGPREILLCRKLVFGPGDYGSHFYRIPAIRQLSDGTLLLVNDRRNVTEKDLPNYIDVVSRFSTDMGQTWSKPVFIARNTGYGQGYGDPALVETEDGTVVCTFCGGEAYYSSSLKTPQRSFVSISHDHGRSWSEPRDITASIWGPDADNPFCERYHSSFFTSGNSLLLTRGPYKGRILVANVTAMEGNVLCNHAVWSDDAGETWHVGDLAYGAPGAPGDEAKMVQLLDGRILMSIRHYGDRIWVISEDGGQTWSKPGSWSELRANNCNGDLIRYDASLLLHTIPASMKRENVSVFLSRDEGRTWPEHRMISNIASMYSSITVLPDGTIGAYLEEQCDNVELWYERFSLDWLLAK